MIFFVPIPITIYGLESEGKIAISPWPVQGRIQDSEPIPPAPGYIITAYVLGFSRMSHKRGKPRVTPTPYSKRLHLAASARFSEKDVTPKKIQAGQ
jgi:hypothetical protein